MPDPWDTMCESSTLSIVRDALLPNLVGGETRVAEAESAYCNQPEEGSQVLETPDIT